MSWTDQGARLITSPPLALPFLCYYIGWPSFAKIGLLSAFILANNKDAVLGLVEQLGNALPVVITAKTLVALAAALLTFGLCGSCVIRPKPSTWNGHGKALLFPCRTTHSRMFPQKHSFAYSYLVVGIPVDWSGSAGGMVSTGVKGSSSWLSWLRPSSLPGRGWYHIDAADYLERGNGNLGLRGKLDAYLISQGLEPGKFPYVYLVTAAKFLGYHFNPVSFWYLYNAEKVLAAMILEVNNTFDERRMYFLLPSDSNSKFGITASKKQEESGRATTEDVSPLKRLTQTWPKDFHVSPFNSRKGSYSLSALDALYPGMQGPGLIDNKIVLRSSKQHGKLTARIFSLSPGIDPTEMTFWQKAVFLARWWWVGFITFPRIVKEAGVLFFVRRLHVWFRPEPLKESFGRQADRTERQLEIVFRKYLRHLVEHSDSSLAVKYVPSGVSDASKELMLSPAAQAGRSGDVVEELEVTVLTPVFYSRFVFYAHDLEALFCELRESCTIWVSRPELLPKLVLRKTPWPPVEAASYSDYISFKAIQRLRRRPEPIERPMTSSQTATSTRAAPAAEDVRSFRISSMDGFVLSSHDIRLRGLYKAAVLKLFLADKLAFGMAPLLDLYRLILDAAMGWALSRYLDWMVKGWMVRGGH